MSDDASSQTVKGSGNKVHRRVHRIAVGFFLGGLVLAWLAAITAWTLSRQLGVVGLQLTHVELDSSSSRELALLKIHGQRAGWTQPHKLSLLEDSHCKVYTDEDGASMADLQLIGVQEDGEQLTLQLEAAFGSEEGEEVQPLFMRAGNFLVKCHLHFDVNIFNSGLSFRTEHVVEKDPTEDSGEPGSAKTHFDFVCKNWEIRKPSSSDLTAVAEAVYFVEFDIPHGRFEVLARFFEEVSVIVKADLDYFVEHSPAAEVEVAVDGRVVARRSNTSTVISIPARVTWKMDAQAMVDLASGISGYIYNGERKSPGGTTVHRSKLGLLSKAPRSAVARAAGPFHELEWVTEERGLQMAPSDLPRLLPPRRLEPGSSDDEGEMPKEQRDIEFKSSLFIDNTAWIVLDVGITEEEFVMFFEMHDLGDDYTTRVQASVVNASDHSNASLRFRDIGGRTIDLSFAVDDSNARVVFKKNCSYTPRRTWARLIYDLEENLCETQEPFEGTIGVELDATWSDLLDMLSDWVHRNSSAASEDSGGSPQSPIGPPLLSGAPKPQVVTSRAWARLEGVRAFPAYVEAFDEERSYPLIDLSWVQNFSRDWKSSGSIGLEASVANHDKGGMTIDIGFAVDDSNARVVFKKNCSSTPSHPCEMEEPFEGTIGVELDATWSDLLDMLSDWVHRNSSAASEDSNLNTSTVTVVADAQANDTKFQLNISDSIWTEVGIGLSLNSMDDFLSVDGVLMDNNFRTSRVTVVADAKANGTKFQLNISDSIWTEVGIGLSLNSMDDFLSVDGALTDSNSNTSRVTVVADVKGNDTELQLDFSDLILTKHNGALSFHSMNNFLSVSGALRDSLVPAATNLSFGIRFSQIDLLSFHLNMKDGLADRLVASIVETAVVGEQRVFNSVHEDHLLSNTQSTGRLSIGGPSMLDSTIKLKVIMDDPNTTNVSAQTTTILSLMLVQDNITAEQPALAVFNMTSEETGHILTVWFSGMQANNMTTGDFGFNILNQVLVLSSKLEAGNGTLHMALNLTEWDGGLKEFFCDAHEIPGGLDSLIFYADRGLRTSLAMRLGDAPSVHNPVQRRFIFSYHDAAVLVNISESPGKNNVFDVNTRIVESEISGRIYYGTHKAVMLEFPDATTVTLFLSSVEVQRSGFPLESSWLARLRISRAGELKDETMELVTFQRGRSPLLTSQHSVIVLTRWSDMFPQSVAQHFSLAEIALQSQIFEWKASVAADFSGFACRSSAVAGDSNGTLTLWWTGEDAAISVLAWTNGILKLNFQVEIPRMTSTPTTLITTTGMLTETTEADTAVEVTTTGGSLAPSTTTKVVIQMALTMDDVSEFDQTALEASLNKELTNAGEEASFRIVSVNYAVKVEYIFAAIVDETQIRQALANIHGVDISQVSVQFKRRLQGPTSKFWPSRLLQSASAVEATILTSDPAQVFTMKDKAESPASLATELTSISGEQVPVPEVSAIPEASVEVVTEIVVNGGSVAPSLLSQTAVSQMVSRAAQDAGFAAPVRVEEPMIVTESTSTTVTAGTDESESGCSQVTPSIASAILLLSWAV